MGGGGGGGVAFRDLCKSMRLFTPKPRPKSCSLSHVPGPAYVWWEGKYVCMNACIDGCMDGRMDA